VPGDNIGLTITTGHRPRVFYAPASPTTTRCSPHADADCVMVDGTFWTDDEMIAAGLSTKPPATSATWPRAAPAA
jgi:pyrroloquinoline quinone biosynthesis protein B